MHGTVTGDRSSWRLPPDETLQVADPKTKKGEVGDEEELTLQDDEGHNWWSIVFALLVIGLVLSGIVAAIFFVGYVDELLYWHGQRMQLEEFLQGELTPSRLPATWVSNSELVYQTDDGSLAVLDTNKNFSVSILVTNHTLRQLNVKGYECSKDLTYVLFQHNLKSTNYSKYVTENRVFRQSFTAHYTVYDVKKDHHIPLRLEDSPKTQSERLQYAKWLQNTTSILIVYNNDIYLRQSPLNETEFRLTFTGTPNIVYNGIPDWLYQEDVLKKPEALWTSSDSSHILFATFNDTNVRTFNFPWINADSILGGKYTNPHNFPVSKSIKYPTPGSLNPTVELWVLNITDLTNLTKLLVKPPKALTGQDYYLTSAGWIGDQNVQVSVVWMNRAQNLSIISSCVAPLWECTETHSERASERSWLDVQEQPIFSADGNSFLTLASVQEGSSETFTHIKHVLVSEKHIAVLSHGRREVEQILAWDPYRHVIYYLGSEEHKPGQRHLFEVRDPTTDSPSRLEAQCITCDLGDVLWSSRYLYGNCTHFHALISPRDNPQAPAFYVLQCLGPGLPLAGVHSASSHNLLKVLYDTRPKYYPMLQKLALPKLKLFEVSLPQGNKAQVQLLLPPSWREELRDAAYPVLSSRL